MLRVTPEDIMKGTYNPTKSSTAPNQQSNLLVSPQEIMAQAPAQMTIDDSQNLFKKFAAKVLGGVKDYSQKNTAKRAGVEDYSQVNLPARMAGAMATPAYAMRDFGKIMIEGEMELGRGVAKIRGLSLDANTNVTLVQQNTDAIKKYLERRDTTNDEEEKKHWNELIKKTQQHTKDILKDFKTDLTKDEKRALVSSVIETGIDIGTMGGSSIVKGAFKGAGKKMAKKGILKTPIREAAAFGGVYGLLGKMREEGDHTAGDYAKSGAVGTAFGAGMGKGIQYLGKAFSKAGKKQELPKVFKKKGKVVKTPVKGLKKSTPTKSQPLPQKQKILAFIEADKTFTVNKIDGIKTPAGKKTKGRYQFDFKTKTGKADVKIDAKPGTIIHEYAHHANFKLGEYKDKFTNGLAKALHGEKAPAILKGYDPKKLYAEMQKAARIGGKNPSKISEEFSEAVRNVAIRPKDSLTTAPTFSKFVKEVVFKGCNGSDPACVRTANKLLAKNKGAKKVYGSYSDTVENAAKNYIRKRKDGMLTKTKNLDHVKVIKDGKYLPDIMDGQIKGAKFFTEREIKQHIVDNPPKIKGKKIGWTSKEDKAVEDYIKTKRGVTKARPKEVSDKLGGQGLEANHGNLGKYMFHVKEPRTVYRGEGKGIGNATLVEGRYVADSEKFAANFGKVTKSEIPQGTKVFDFDPIKNNPEQKVIPEKLMVDQRGLTDWLMDRGIKWTKNTNSRGVEYVELKRDPEKVLIKVAEKAKDYSDFISRASKTETEAYRRIRPELPFDVPAGSPRGQQGVDELYKIYTDAKKKQGGVPKFRTTPELTLKSLDSIEKEIKKPVISKQALLAHTKRQGIRPVEGDIFTKVLGDMPGEKVDVKEFADRVRNELLPLSAKVSWESKTSKGFDPKRDLGGSRYEQVSLPAEKRGAVVDYKERVYESPIETSAGDVHFKNVSKYFAHSRIEDMAGGKIRRVIEVQSDLFQKGRLGREKNIDSSELDLLGPPYYNLSKVKQLEYEALEVKIDNNTITDIEKLRYEKFEDEITDIFNRAEMLAIGDRANEIKTLQPYRNTYHERIIKEEIKTAAKDGKEKLQFPTGETAMKVEGLGGDNMTPGVGRGWRIDTDPNIADIMELPELTPQRLKVGENIVDVGEKNWVITEILGDGKFKAVQKETYERLVKTPHEDVYGATKQQLSDQSEQFDISGKMDTSNPIYKFYEDKIQKYLKKIHPEMKKIIDDQGVAWFEVKPTAKEGLSPVQAFRREGEEIMGKKFTQKQVTKIKEINQKIFGDDNIKITHQIMTPEGQSALGVYQKDMIKIAKGQADIKDTYYHEAVHKYLDMATTMAEHKEALIAAKRQFKVKTFGEAEEKLAESFIKYAKSREGVTGALKRFFDKVLRRVKAIEGNKGAIDDFYKQIVDRKYNPKTDVKGIKPDNIPKKFVERKKDKTKYTEKLNTSEGVNSMVKKLEKSDSVQREIQKRGIVSWKETAKQANAMGLDLKGIKKEAKTASAFAARIEAIKQARANKASELHDFLSASPRNPSDAQKAEIARKIDEFLFVDRSLKSISTEHGRAINILKKEVLAQEFETYNKLIDDILEIDPKKASELDYVKAVDKVVDPKMHLLLNIMNFPRSAMASTDLSAPLRQGIFLINHPKKFAKAGGSMFKQAFSEKSHLDSMARIEKMDTYQQMKKNGLALMDLGGDATKREEAIMSNLPERIPGFGKVVRGSNRAYTGFLNELRADVFEDLYKKSETLGLHKENDKIAKDIASFVNTASGRGDIGMFTRHAEVMNSLFFSPRLIASRIQLLNPRYYHKLDPFVRKEALKSLFTFVGAGATVLGLAKMGGAEVGADPRSSDFGKIKIGDTRFDIWGGFQQYAVLASRLVTNQMVSSTTGKEYDLGEGYKPTTRGTIATRFFMNKLSPVASFAKGLFTGKAYMGEDFDLAPEMVRRTMPIVMADVYDLAKDGKAHYAIPAVFGVGTLNYTDKIPFKTKTPTGRPKIEWKQRPDLAEDIVDIFRGKEVSNVPKNQWKSLYEKKKKKDTQKAELNNAKRRVLRTGKAERLQGKRIYLKDGIVKVK